MAKRSKKTKRKKRSKKAILKNEGYLTKAFFMTIRHFFPELDKTIQKISDPRNKNKITYSLRALIWIGILFFIMKLEKRAALSKCLNTESVYKNINGWLNIDKIPHGDTLNYLFSKLAVKFLNNVRTYMIRSIIRMKCFVNLRLLDVYYMISVDGTQTLNFTKRHCKHCLTKKSKKTGKTIYYHNVLEAKLVFSIGFAFSIATEFVENESPHVTKQDCELKAFYRMEKKLKKQFPQLKIVIIADSLYPCQQVFNICGKNKWAFIITFKKGAIPTLYEEFEALKKLQPENRKKILKYDIVQHFFWVTDIDYEGNIVHIVECQEYGKGKLINKFVYITNIKPTYYNVHLIVNEGGRQRWKIENQGFNTQKNGGYNLEHNYSFNPNSWKNFYLLMQIAHIINQLIEKGNLIPDPIRKSIGGIKRLSERLKEEFKYILINFKELKIFLSKKIQIRFNTS